MSASLSSPPPIPGLSYTDRDMIKNDVSRSDCVRGLGALLCDSGLLKAATAVNRGRPAAAATSSSATIAASSNRVVAAPRVPSSPSLAASLAAAIGSPVRSSPAAALGTGAAVAAAASDADKLRGILSDVVAVSSAAHPVVVVKDGDRDDEDNSDEDTTSSPLPPVDVEAHRAELARDASIAIATAIADPVADVVADSSIVERTEQHAVDAEVMDVDAIDTPSPELLAPKSASVAPIAKSSASGIAPIGPNKSAPAPAARTTTTSSSATASVAAVAPVPRRRSRRCSI